MATARDVVGHAITARLYASAKRKDFLKKGEGDRLNNLYVSAYYQGVEREAQMLIDLFDGSRTPEQALEGVREFGERFLAELDGALEDADDAG